jgi:hypothetical protein
VKSRHIERPIGKFLGKQRSTFSGKPAPKSIRAEPSFPFNKKVDPILH